MAPQKLHPPLNRLRLQHIVTIRPDQVLPCHKRQPLINRSRRIPMLCLHNPEIIPPGSKSLKVSLRHLHSPILRAIIHQNHLHPGISLPQHRIQHPRQIPLPIKNRRNHRNLPRLIHISLLHLSHLPSSIFPKRVRKFTPTIYDPLHTNISHNNTTAQPPSGTSPDHPLRCQKTAGRDKNIFQ